MSQEGLNGSSLDKINDGKIETEKDPETIKYIKSIIAKIRSGEYVGPNFSFGPLSVYGNGDKTPFDGYSEYIDKEQVDKWRIALDPASFKALYGMIYKDSREINPDPIELPDGVTYEPGGVNNSKVYYFGKTFESPATSYGNGGYEYWTEYPDCWMHEERRETVDGKGNSYWESHVSIALKMTNEEKEEYIRGLEVSYGIE